MIELPDQLDEAVKTVRRITAGLRPVMIDHSGLAAAMQWHLSELEKQNNLSCTIDAEMPSSFSNKQISINLFRIFQDTIDNILRYTTATNVHIGLRSVDDDIQLVITSDGRNSVLDEPYASKKAVAVLSMQQRADMIGGKYSIEGPATGGSVTYVSVPYV